MGPRRAVFRFGRAFVWSGLPWSVLLCVACLNADVAAQEAAIPGKLYRITDGKVDARTYNGYRRYHAVCNHCHGPDGMAHRLALRSWTTSSISKLSAVSCTTAKAVERRS